MTTTPQHQHAGEPAAPGPPPQDLADPRRWRALYLSQVLPASVVLALGSWLCPPTLGGAAVHRVTGDDTGLASGVQQALQQIGGAVGTGVLVVATVLAAALLRPGVGHGEPAAVGAH